MTDDPISQFIFLLFFYAGLTGLGILAALGIVIYYLLGDKS